MNNHFRGLVILGIAVLMLPFGGNAQWSGLPQQLELNAPQTGDERITDDPDTEQQEEWAGKKINLNGNQTEVLVHRGLISSLQQEQLIRYRDNYGDLYHPAELQAVPLWTPKLVEEVMPQVYCSPHEPWSKERFGRLWHTGTWQLSGRVDHPVGKKAGFSTPDAQGSSVYPGLEQAFYLRFRYRCGTRLSYGLIAEQDAGESFRRGFDFYSFHLAFRGIGKLEHWILGDFQVRMGQGLVHWNGFGMRIQSQALMNRKIAQRLQPNTSANEFDFMRGMAFETGTATWKFFAFGSYRKLDPSGLETGTDSLGEWTSRGFNTSGLHRTASEIGRKGLQDLYSGGGGWVHQKKHWHWGIHGVYHQFRIPMERSREWYDRYAVSGKRVWNAGGDFHFSYRNFQWFGELALAETLRPAGLLGMLFTAGKWMEAAWIGRYYDAGYHSLFNRAFSSRSTLGNEMGLFLGVVIHPHGRIELTHYTDWSFAPWFRYQINGSSVNREHFTSLLWKPGKKFALEIRHQFSSSVKNPADFTGILTGPVPVQLHRFRIGFSADAGKGLHLDSRLEASLQNGSPGYLLYQEVGYRSGAFPISGAFRFSVFGIPGFNGRIYAYEKDVLFGFSLPSVYGQGIRWYALLKGRINRHLECWVRYGQTQRFDVSTLGSGNEAIARPWSGELRVQFRLSFSADKNWKLPQE